MLIRNSLTSLLLFCFILLACPAFSTPALSENSIEKVQQLAREKQLPYLVYVYKDNSRDCRRMNRRTWKDPALNQYMDQHYLSCQMDAIQAQNSLEWLQKNKVYHYPTVLFFSSEGKILGRTEGYVAPITLRAILAKHRRELARREQMRLIVSQEIQQAEAVVVQTPSYTSYSTSTTKTSSANVSEKDSGTSPLLADTNSQTKEVQNNAYAGLSRGQLSSQLHLEVPGMEAFKLDPSIFKEAQDSYGLVVGTYTSYRDMEMDVKRYQRIWWGDVWVYCEEVHNVPVYKILLGRYESQEKADIFAQSIYKFQGINPTVLNLKQLFK